MKTHIDRGTWIIVLGGAAVAALYVTLAFLPQQRAIAKLADEVKAKQAYLAGPGNLAAIIEASQGDLERTQTYNAAWREQAPNGKELAALFGQISALAKTAGITTTRFDPEPIVSLEEIREIPLTVGYRGTYAQVHKFLADMEGLPESIWVDRIGIDVTPQDGKDIQVEMKLVIFADNPDNSGQVDRSGQPIQERPR